MVSAIVEHAAFVTSVFMSILALRTGSSLHGADESFFRQLYIAISFPEPLCKIPVLVLLTWDSNLGLLVLMAFLTCSIQVLALQSVINNASKEKVVATLFFAILVKVASRLMFFSPADILALGFFM
jgi:hypothetical protein